MEVISPKEKLIAAAYAAGLSPAEISAGLRDDSYPFNSETAIKKIIAQFNIRNFILKLQDDYRKTIYELDVVKAKEWRLQTDGVADAVKAGTDRLATTFFEKMDDLDLDEVNPNTMLKMFELVLKGSDLYSRIKKTAIAPDSVVFGIVAEESKLSNNGLIILPPQTEP